MRKMIRFAALFAALLLAASSFCFAVFAEEGTAAEQPGSPAAGILAAVIGACIFGGIAVFFRWRFANRSRNDYNRYR